MIELLKTWFIGVRSDLVKVGVGEEDGEDIIRERFFIFAENVVGQRLAFTEESYDNEARAQKVADHMVRLGLDPKRSGWAKIDPAYGSPAYEFEQPEIVAAERRRDLEGG